MREKVPLIAAPGQPLLLFLRLLGFFLHVLSLGHWRSPFSYQYRASGIARPQRKCSEMACSKAPLGSFEYSQNMMPPRSRLRMY